MCELATTMTDVNTVRLGGVLDGDAALQLRPRLDALAAGGGDVVMDLRDVSFVDGSGIAAIAFLFKRLTRQGRRLNVVAEGLPLAMLRDLGIAAVLGLPARRSHARGFAGPRWGASAARAVP